MDSAFCLIYGNKNYSVSPLAVGNGCTSCIFDFKRSTTLIFTNVIPVRNLIPPPPVIH